MPTLKLTAKFIEGIKPGATRTEYFDTDVKGLSLRVTPNGAKSWTLLYRDARQRQRRLTLGDAEALSLADARDRARTERTAVSKGADPATVKIEGRRASTINELATHYLEWVKTRKKTWKADRNLIRRKILPKWRSRAIADITTGDVARLVVEVGKTAPIVANRLQSCISMMFKYALHLSALGELQATIDRNPAVGIMRPGKERARNRVFTDPELRTLWAAFEQLPTPMAAFWKLRLLTAQRGGEVTDMRWQDVDLEDGWWTLPDTKNGMPHRVPLVGEALRIVQALKASAEPDTVYVLGSFTRTAGTGARGNRQQADAAATFKVPDFEGHDLRRTASTRMLSGRLPIATHVDKVLNHVNRSVTGRHYDQYSYDQEKVEALTWWDRKLKAILANEPSKVLPFKVA